MMPPTAAVTALHAVARTPRRWGGSRRGVLGGDGSPPPRPGRDGRTSSLLGLVGEGRHHAGLGVVDVVAVGHPLAGVVGVEVDVERLCMGRTMTVSLRAPPPATAKVCPCTCIGWNIIVWLTNRSRTRSPWATGSGVGVGEGLAVDGPSVGRHRAAQDQVVCCGRTTAGRAGRASAGVRSVPRSTWPGELGGRASAAGPPGAGAHHGEALALSCLRPRRPAGRPRRRG